MITALHVGSLVLQGILALTLLEGIRRRDVAATVNALIALFAALLPSILEFGLSFTASAVTFGPELPLWIATAGVIHAFGMLGLYESTWWWDHLAHTVSAALIAALAYASLIVLVRYSNTSGLPVDSIAGLTILFVFVVGVFWELVELIAREIGERYGIQPVLVHYGWRDTALDLVFNLLGSLFVVAVDLRVFVPIAQQYPNVTQILLFGSGGFVVGGSVLMAATIRYGNDD